MKIQNIKKKNFQYKFILEIYKPQVFLFQFYSHLHVLVLYVDLMIHQTHNSCHNFHTDTIYFFLNNHIKYINNFFLFLIGLQWNLLKFQRQYVCFFFYLVFKFHFSVVRADYIVVLVIKHLILYFLFHSLAPSSTILKSHFRDIHAKTLSNNLHSYHTSDKLIFLIIL